MDINDRIFYLLKEKGKTAKELSEFIGVKQSSISAWKSGSFPSSKYVIRISEFLDVSPAFLLTGNNDQMPQLSEGERDILELVHPLSPKEQQRVVGVIESYLGKRQPPQQSIPVSLKPSAPSASTTPSDDKFREHIQENFSDTLELIAKLAK